MLSEACISNLQCELSNYARLIMVELSITHLNCTGSSAIEWTHLPLDKMAAILAVDIFKCIFLNEKDRIPIQIPLKFVPRSPIDN